MEDKEKKSEVKKKKTSVKKELREDQKKGIDEVKEENIREVIVEHKSGFNYAEVIVIMIITLILGGMIGSFITYIMRDEDSTYTPVVSEVPKELQEFVDAYHNIISDYYQDIDHDKLLEAGISGMLQYLDDDYSLYMNKEQSQNFNEQVEGKYTGIGVEITLKDENQVVITRVFDKTPASKAGLRVGDIFVAINGEDVSGMNASDISNKIKSGDKNVSLTMNRDGKNKDFNLTLEEVELDSVTSEIFEKNGKKIGYLELSIFASNTYEQFERKLLELEGKKIDSLIIDVRDNSGGYLTTVTDIASLFMNKKKIIYQLDTKGVIEQIYSKSNMSRSYDIIVLINKNSASASEILASSLQESYGAKVLGVNSFGKGTVQKAYQLESGATVKYTIQKWLTPNGNWINEVGVEPDIKVELDASYYENPSHDTDTQLQTALEELSK